MNLKTVFYDWYGWNARLFELLNASLPEAAQPVAHVGSALGSYWAAPFMLATLVGWARYAQAISPAISPVKIRLQAYRFGCAGLLALISTSVLKWGLAFPRPSAALIHSVRVLAPVERLHSFPSGHSAYAALVFAALWPLASSGFRVVLVAFLFWVGFARIAMGAHFPADVVGGWLVGAGCMAMACATVANKSAPPERRPLGRSSE